MINGRIYDPDAHHEAISRYLEVLKNWKELLGESSHPAIYDDDNKLYIRTSPYFIINSLNLFYYIEKYISTKKSKWISKYIKHVNNPNCIIGFNNIIFTDKPNKKLSKLITRKRGVI